MRCSFAFVYQGRESERTPATLRPGLTDEEECAKSLGGFNARANALSRTLAVIDAAGLSDDRSRKDPCQTSSSDDAQPRRLEATSTA